MKFYVSRQKYWNVDPEDGTIVEVAQGGSDYANPDQLCAKYPRLGEGKEFDDPREAIEAAISVCEAWRADGVPSAKVAFGYTGGNTLPFEGDEYDSLRQRAEALYDKMDKCECCGGILPDKRKRYMHSYMPGEFVFCSERCADKDYCFQVEQDEKYNAEMEAE